MIVRMKELLLFTSARTADDTVQALGELGVVDVKELRVNNSSKIERRATALAQAEQAISQLSALAALTKKSGPEETVFPVNDPKQLVDRVLATTSIKTKCTEQLLELTQQLAWYDTWGEEVSLREVNFLRKQGLFLHLYVLEEAEWAQLRTQHTLLPLSSPAGGQQRVVLVTTDPTERLRRPEIDWPSLSLPTIRQHILRKRRQLAAIDQFLEEQIANIPLLEEYQLLLLDQLGFERILEGMGDVEGRLKYLKGYLPEEAVESFVASAEGRGWAYQLNTPENPEDVPVYVKNPKWISMINPIMKFIDIVPGYREVDVSIYFLIAFALFFAMLVGDAGYGLVFLLVTLFLRKKLSQQVRLLFYVLSGATIVWGVLSGTYFGAAAIAQMPFFKSLMVENMSSFGVDNIDFMMHLSFLIGAIHLSFARSIRAAQVINSVRALSEVGWILLIWGLFFLTEQLVLSKPMPSWGSWLFVGGAVLVALFSQESKSLRTSILVSLANLPLSLISGFSDIVSYVRLFAVGLATAAVAASFNNMILPAGVSGMGFLDLLMAAIALLLGHGLNIALALMAVMVHGVRLNMLEFAGHLGVEFSGQAYKPFRLLSPPEDQNGQRQNAWSNRLAN